MKRTCNGCKALSQSKYFYCELGYKLTSKREYEGITIECKPLEECPKPKTNDEYCKEVINK